jgi:hypothetical protein
MKFFISVFLPQKKPSGSLIYVLPKLISSGKFEFAEIVEFIHGEYEELDFLSILMRMDSWLFQVRVARSSGAEYETLRFRRVRRMEQCAAAAYVK